MIEHGYGFYPKRHWYDDHRNLYSLANTMLEDGYEVSGVLDMLAKPWKYEDLYTQTVTPAQEARIEPLKVKGTLDDYKRELLQQGLPHKDVRNFIDKFREGAP